MDTLAYCRHARRSPCHSLRVDWWGKPPRRADALDLQEQVLEKVKATLTKNGIDLPYPTRQILFHDQTEATDGERRRQCEGWSAGPGEVPLPARQRGANARAPGDAG